MASVTSMRNSNNRSIRVPIPVFCAKMRLGFPNKVSQLTFIFETKQLCPGLFPTVVIDGILTTDVKIARQTNLLDLTLLGGFKDLT